GRGGRPTQLHHHLPLTRVPPDRAPGEDLAQYAFVCGPLRTQTRNFAGSGLGPCPASHLASRRCLSTGSEIAPRRPLEIVFGSWRRIPVPNRSDHGSMSQPTNCTTEAGCRRDLAPFSESRNLTLLTLIEVLRDHIMA